MNNNLLNERYRPKYLDDLIGNKKNIQLAEKWIDDFKNLKPNTPKMLLISGPPGIGKTTFAKILLKENGYSVIEYNASDVRSQKLVKENLGKIIDNQNIDKLTKQKGGITGIIMDEIDGMSSGDRGGVSELISLIAPSKGKGRKKKDYQDLIIIKNPIICICNSFTEKKITDIKKVSLHLNFTKPNFYDLEKLYNRILVGEKFKIDDDYKSKIIYSCQNDVRRLTNVLSEIKSFLKSGGNISEFIGNIINKDIDYGLYESVEKAICNYNNIDTNLRFYEVDKNLVGMMIHENYINHIESNIADTKLNKKKNILNIIDYFSSGDILDNYIYNQQSWELFDICGTIKIASSSYYINILKKKKYKENNDIVFTNILNKSTMQCIYNKTLTFLVNKFNTNIESTKILIDFLLYNIFNENGDLIKALKLFKKYELELNDIDKLLKINKKYKKKYTEKMKKYIKKKNDEITEIKS